MKIEGIVRSATLGDFLAFAAATLKGQFEGPVVMDLNA